MLYVHHLKLGGALALLTSLVACGGVDIPPPGQTVVRERETISTTVSGTTVTEVRTSVGVEITNRLPRKRRTLPQRDDIVFSCTNVQALYDYVDGGYLTRGCTVREMTYAIPRGFYRALDGSCYRVVQFYVGTWDYYGIVPVRRCPRSSEGFGLHYGVKIRSH